jgi:hypothetical protein
MRRHPPYLLAAALTCAGLTAAATTGGCRYQRLNANHCARNLGDATCAELYPDGSRPFCGGECVDSVGDDGCVETRPPDDCYAPCGGAGNDADPDDIYVADGIDPSCDGVATTDDGTETETGTDSNGPGTQPSSSGPTSSSETETATETTDDTDTGPTGCDGPEDCSGDEPFCENEVCVACSQTGDPDGSCEDLDATHPLCVDDVCVACTEDNQDVCADATPVCNPGSGECVPEVDSAVPGTPKVIYLIGMIFACNGSATRSTRTACQLQRISRERASWRAPSFP